MKTVIFKTILLLLALAVDQMAFSQVSGKITVTKDFYDALKTMHGSSLLKTALQLEVWRVQYFDVQTELNGTKTAVTRIYLQEKWSGASIPLTEEVVAGNVNLKFTIKNLPMTAKGGAKYALVYHLNAYPEQYKTVRFDEKGNDGSGRLNLRYQANFSATLGEKQAVGLTSLTSSSTQTYTINLFSSTQVVAFGLLSDIGDFFSDAADLLWEGGKFLAGVVVDATGTILAQAYGMAQALVLDDGVIIPRYRELTANEYTFVNSKIFKYTLPPRDKIIVTNLLGLSKRPFTWATGVDGKIMMNLGKKGYDNAASVLGFYANGELAGQILIHEMAHVWQLHHSENISFDLQSLKNQACNFFSDQYTYQCGLAWNDYNLEQQAKIVEHCFFKREKLIATNCEEPYVVANIREGVSFRTPECQKLVDDIAAKNREINKRIDELKVAWLIEQGETVVMNADGTIKVGSDKGIGSVSIPTAILNSDSRLTQLKAELAVLEQRRAAINCR